MIIKIHTKVSKSVRTTHTPRSQNFHGQVSKEARLKSHLLGKFNNRRHKKSSILVLSNNEDDSPSYNP